MPILGLVEIILLLLKRSKNSNIRLYDWIVISLPHIIFDIYFELSHAKLVRKWTRELYKNLTRSCNKLGICLIEESHSCNEPSFPAGSV